MTDVEEEMEVLQRMRKGFLFRGVRSAGCLLPLANREFPGVAQ
jgi:hypothetical protein